MGAAGWQLGSSVDVTHPDLRVVVALVVVALVATGAAVFAPTPLGLTLEVVHVIGAALGMFGAVILLGRLRLDSNEKRVGGRFVDWPVEADSIGTLLFVAAWLAGLANLWFLGIEISRAFT